MQCAHTDHMANPCPRHITHPARLAKTSVTYVSLALQRDKVPRPQKTMGGKNGLRTYYQGKIDELEITIQDKTQNLRRLEAQRNQLNAAGMLAVGL